jgi:hypothetical protein
MYKLAALTISAEALSIKGVALFAFEFQVLRFFVELLAAMCKTAF